MSGQALIALFDGDGAAPQLLLQCHQPLIGAPSPAHANQPWYPTVILPTTSPGALAAAAGEGSVPFADVAAVAAAATAAVRRTVRRDGWGVLALGTVMETSPTC